MHRIVKIQNEPESLRYDGSNANYPIDGKRRRKFANGCSISGQSLRPKNIRPEKFCCRRGFSPDFDPPSRG